MKKKRNTSSNTSSVEDLWMEINDLRAIQNKTLTALNKWLRGHGRSIQAQTFEEEEELPRVKRTGLIMSR